MKDKLTWDNIYQIEYQHIDENLVGFVYKIEELDTGKFYYGIKRFWEYRKLKPLKGKVNRRIKKVESNWRDYNSSNKELQQKIKENPKNYKKTMLVACASITEMKAREAYYQLREYLYGDWSKCYNQMINLRLRIRK